MKNHNIRVVVAAEHPEVRHMLGRLVEREGGTTVGEAQDAPRTMTLVKDLKPDLALIDCDLPYITSHQTLPMSRVGGLDTAQRIRQEMPGTGTVLLGNLDTIVIDHRVIPENGVIYCMKNIENNMPLVIRNLHQAAARPADLVFANVETRPQELPGPAASDPSGKAIFIGAMGIVLGWFLIISWISTIIGVAVALAGVTVVLLGIGGKLAASLWHRFFADDRRKP